MLKKQSHTLKKLCLGLFLGTMVLSNCMTQTACAMNEETKNIKEIDKKIDLPLLNLSEKKGIQLVCIDENIKNDKKSRWKLMKPKINIDFNFSSKCESSFDDIDEELFDDLKSEKSDLNDVETYVENLLTIEKVKPTAILFFGDVDGTLTNYSDPQCIDYKKFLQRGNAAKFIKMMKEKGVNLVISSAWDNFKETLHRLKLLGLDDVLKIDKGSPIKGTKQLDDNDENSLVEYFQLGHVASVKYEDSFFGGKYYRQKAFSYQFVYPDLDSDSITHVVFADDSEENVSQFKEDILKTKLKDKNIKIFTLSQVRGEKAL